MSKARKAFEAAGFSTAGLSDQQVRIAAERLVAEHGDHTPSTTDIDRALGSVRFQDRLEEIKVSVKPRIEVTCCVPVKVPYPSGQWVQHSRHCLEHPKEKIRRVGHPANGKKRLADVHRAEDIRSTVVPIRGGSCAKCGGPATGTYCGSCSQLLGMIRENYRGRV